MIGGNKSRGEIYNEGVGLPFENWHKCLVGMITPSRFQTLHKAFYRAKLAGLHEAITPAPTSFASELLGLLARKTMLENKHASKK
eukprot:1160900-Pelagomonas_calceolata.AAC.6